MSTLRELIDAYERPDLYCRYGHERAVYERRYPRDGAAPIRQCLECRRLRGRHDRRRPVPIRPTTHPDDRLWDHFCRTIEQRIQAVRAMTPRCGECGRSA